MKKCLYLCDWKNNETCPKTMCSYVHEYGQCRLTFDESKALRRANGQPALYEVIDIDDEQGGAT